MERTPTQGGTVDGDERRHRADTALAALRRRVQSRFAVDARALAALRITLGVALLVDLLTRARYLELFYTDAGVYPRAVMTASGTGGEFSLHALSGAAWFQWLLFAVAGLFALLFVVGYRTRLVGAASLLLLFSVQLRNPAVLNGGDRLLRVLLFIALLAPLGERWSVDALRRGTARRTVVGATTVALLVQPVAVFTSNALLKAQGETWYAGEALTVAFANDAMTIGLGNHLGEYPALLTTLNWAWVVLLAGSALFLLGTDGRLRALAVFAYLGAFAGMAATMGVGLFPLVLAASVLPFLTAPFWETAGRLVPDRLAEYLAERRPTAASLGALAGPPLERRVLGEFRRRGHERAAAYAVDYARSLLTVIGVLVLLWIVLFSASHATGVDLPDAVESQAPNEQRWGLYAPDPSTGYSWYVHEAELGDGGTADALGEGNATVDRPPDVAATYDSFRHRKFMSSVDAAAADEDDPLDERYAEWTCERATEVHGDDVRRVTVYRVAQYDAPAEDPPALSVTPLVEQKCSPSATAAG
ncbi:HTTM domain-containing protein [Natronomonas salina]|uniref:HTTM domain-containing protein n=1 Tax=Natronomonas salina TaxID=1710540 RepID=UPI0015B5F312|nr:HTTM domain-containing protein [Natronomonas salina]QLD88880.1 HTTM domain-containing protein [Natronomonas salina]